MKILVSLAADWKRRLSGDPRLDDSTLRSGADGTNQHPANCWGHGPNAAADSLVGGPGSLPLHKVCSLQPASGCLALLAKQVHSHAPENIHQID